MDIDIAQGDYMVNTQCVYSFQVVTDTVQAGTDVTVKIPFDLQVIATTGSVIGYCKESGFNSNTNTYTDLTLTNCIYNEYIGYSAITFKVGQSYSGIQAYYFYIGMIRNPPSVRYPDSFEVTFANGFPSGTFNQGLVLNYIPNKIYGATLTKNYLQAGTNDTYVFKFKITNNILQRGYIQIVYPSPWTSASQSILSMTSFNIYGTAKSGFGVQSPITSTVTYTDLFYLAGLTADSTKYITLTIAGITNPSSISTSGSFQITTLDDAMQEIDQITTGLTVSITQPGVLVIESFTVGDKTVDTYSFIQFTITPSVKYTTGGYIEVSCPAAYMSTSASVTCTGSLGMVGSLTCTRLNSTTIRLTKNLSNGLLVTLFQVIFSVGNYRNALGVLTNSPFTIQFKESDGSIVAQSLTGVVFTTVAGTITVSSSIRSTTVLTVGLTGALYTLIFTCKTRIPTVGRFVFVFPDEQVSYSASTTCQDGTGKDLGCTLTQGTGIFTATIAASQYCSTECAAGSSFTLVLINAKNPSYINSPITNSVQITTQNFLSSSYVTIDTVTTNVFYTNSLIPGTLTSMSLTRTGSQLTGAVPIYTFSFQSAIVLPNGAVISISFPTATAYYSSSLTVTCTISSISKTCTNTALSTDSSQLTSVLVSSACTSTTCAALLTYSVQITNFINPFSNIANIAVTFTIQTKVSASNGLVDTGSFSAAQMALTPNSLTVALTSPTTPIIVGDINSYTFTVANPTNKIPSTTDSGSLVISFPAEVVIQSSTCSAQTASITLTCVASTSAQTVTVTSSTELAKGNTITVQLVNNVKNPPTGATSSTFSFNTYYGIANIDRSTSLTVKPDTFNDIVNPTSNRDIVTVNTAFKLSISFQTTNPIPANAQIKFYVPTDQALIGSTTFTVTDKSGSGTVSIVSTLSGPTSNFNIFTVKEWCSNDNGGISCPTTFTSKIDITGLKNPANAYFPSNSIKIEIYTSAGDKIDSVSTNFYTIPQCNYGAMQSVSITRTIDVVGQSTTYKFNFQTNTNGDLGTSGFVNIFFPVAFLFDKSSPTPSCTVKDATSSSSSAINSACIVTKITDPNNMGSYISKIVGSLNCATINCGGSAQFEFSIIGYSNPFSTKPRDGQIISTSTSTGSGATAEIKNVLDQIIGTDITKIQLPDFTPGTIIVNTLIRTVLNVDTNTNIQFSLTLPTRLEKNGYIQVSVPSTQFDPNGDNFQYQQSTGTSSWGSSLTLSVATQTSTETVFLLKEWCSSTNNYCSDNTVYKFQIVKGFSNVGYVATATNFFTITTYTRDDTYKVDTVSNVIATPAVIPAVITVSSVTFSQSYAAYSGITVDINVKFGATIKSGIYVLLTFDTEFIRKDSGDITCSYVSGTTEITKTCTTAATLSTVNTIQISDFCTSTCDDTSTYTIRLKNVVNRLYVDAFSGIMLVETRIDSITLVSTVSYSLSNVATLSPGPLTSQVVTRSKTTQGIAADYSLSWTIQGYLLDESLVEIRFPSNQVIISTGTAFTFKDSSANTLTFSVTSGSPTTTYNIFQATEWKCTGMCSSGVTFSIVVSNSKNPFIQSTNYDAFVIIHKRTDGKLIFQSTSPLNASLDLAFGVIDAIAITHQNYQYVARTTEYVYNFTVEADIPAGGKIRLTFPTARVLQYTATTMTCKLGTISYPCTATYSTTTGISVVISNVCTSLCTSPLIYSVTLSGGMKNPASVPTALTGNFVIETLSSSNFIVSQGKLDNSLVSLILAEPIVAVVTRTSPYMAAINDYRIDFQTMNPIPVGGYIRIIFPTDQVLLPSNGPSCKVDYILTVLTCNIVYKLIGYIWVDIKSPCTTGCAAGYQVQLLFQSLQNPSTFLSNAASTNWTVYTMNSSKEYIDGDYGDLKATPALIGKTAVIKAVELDDNIVARQTYINFLIVPGSAFTTEAIFDIYFPNKISLSYGNTICYVVIGGNIGMNCTFTNNLTSGFISKVSLSKPCPYGCDETGIYLFKIPIKNRGDNFQTSGEFSIIERYTDIDVGQGTILNTLVIVPDKIIDYYITNDGRNTIDQDSKIYLSFLPVNYLPNAINKGRVRIVVPSQIILNSNICQAQINGNTGKATCSISSKIVTVTHTTSAIAGSNLTIEIQKIFNPSSTRPTDPFLIYTEVDSQNTGVYYQIDQNLINVTYNITGLTPLLNIAITRSPMNDLTGYQTGQATKLFFSIQLKHALESTSSFIVQMPLAAQAMINPASSTATCYSTDSRANKLNLLLCEIISTNRTIIVRNYCQVASCTVKSKVYFQMFEDFIQNYHYVVYPLNITKDSMLVRTTTKEGYYYIDETSTNVFIKPDLVPTYLILPSPEIIRTNNVINRKVSWVMSFKTNKNMVPQGGYVVLNVPQNVLLTIKNSSIDVLNYDNSVIYPNFTTYLYSDGLSVQNITINNFCNATKGCPVGAAYSLLFDWIKNPISQLGDISNNITIRTFTKEGYAAEQGTTPAVYKLFSELIPVNLVNLFIRVANPVPSVITNYEFTFSADAEFNTTNILLIKFPSELNPFPNVTTSRILSSKVKCVSILNPWAILSCTQQNNTLVVNGLFLNNFQQYSIRVYDVLNPSVSGPTSGFTLEVQNSLFLTIASRSTNTRITILDPIIDQSTCNKVCGSCAGTTATCTSCKNPSKYPIFRNYACVDGCGDGYFFDENNLQCIQCHHGCSNCYGPGKDQCFTCLTGYYQQDGQCVPYCSKGLIEDSVNKLCLKSNQTLCNSNCKNCSFSSDYCTTCKQDSIFPVLDKPSGKCIANNQNLCNGTSSQRFYIDQAKLQCKVCNELCRTCERGNNICTSCQSFQLNNIVNELYETCVDTCGLGTWYNSKQNQCSYCNQVCLICNGYESDNCLVCNKTPEARQLYLYDNTCVLQCPQRYSVNEINNQCQEGQAQILSFSFLFMFCSLLAGLILVAASMIITKNKNKTIDIIYATMSGIEALDRLFLLGNMWFKSNVFALAVCFMNLIATCAIAVFFNFLFMSPIYAHSPHFRTLYKKFGTAYQTVTCISYFAGVNIMRLLCSNLLGQESLQSDLNNWKFFVVPLNTMSNFTIIFSICQMAINVFILMTLTISDDAFVLAILGLLMNITMITLQIFKHLNTKAFMIRRS